MKKIGGRSEREPATKSWDRFGKRSESKTEKQLRVNQSEVNCHYRGGRLLNDMSNSPSMTGITYIYVPNPGSMTCARYVLDS